MHHGVHAHVHHRRQFGGILGGDNSNGKNPLQQFGDDVGSFLTGGNSDDGGDNSNGGSDNSSPSPSKQPKVSIVYYTPPPTFSGPIGGYSTLDGSNNGPNTPNPPAATPTPKATPTKDSSSKDSPSSSPTPTPDSQTASPKQQQTSLVKSIKVTSDSSLTSPTQSISNAAASTSPDAGQSLTQTSNQGMSDGAKAGIAIGVILGILLLIGAAYAVYRHRQNQMHRAEENEKNPFTDNAAIHHEAATAPAMATAAAAAAITHPMQQRSNDTAQSNNPSNPFGNHAETVPTVKPVPGPNSFAPAGNSFAQSQSGIDSEKAAMGVGIGAAAGIAAAAAAHRQNAPQPLELNRSQSPALAVPAMPSPAASQFSNTSMASSAVAAGAPANNVHRVQMDFTPSMEDELALRAGELVRVMHEYDDGWALCVRLDRSQQGVCPRTCLSTRPLKPRNGPPRGPGPFPVGPGSAPQTPRPQTGSKAGPAPVNTAYGPPRAMSPALNPNPVKRSMSPGPYGGGPQAAPSPPFAGRPRSNSAGEVREKRNNLPGPSPMNPGNTVAAQGSSNITQQVAAPMQLPPSLATGSSPASPVTRKPVPNRASS